MSAQTQFQSSDKADVNLNGVGEYGTLGEMSGGIGVRGGAALTANILSSSFRLVSANGEVSKSGYHYAIYLPQRTVFTYARLSGDYLPSLNLAHYETAKKQTPCL